jgi:hypothetical protein
MLDKQTELMLEVANELTAEDLDYLRGSAPAVAEKSVAPPSPHCAPEEMEMPPAPQEATQPDSSRGARERQRTRESKISTACTGQSRAKHDWWPLGTELIGRMRDQTFTAEVVENAQVKSNRSLRITSGPAQNNVCITPTRAALEATEAFRQANGLGRGGGVTNGWSFWKPAQ